MVSQSLLSRTCRRTGRRLGRWLAFAEVLLHHVRHHQRHRLDRLTAPLAERTLEGEVEHISARSRSSACVRCRCTSDRRWRLCRSSTSLKTDWIALYPRSPFLERLPVVLDGLL